MFDVRAYFYPARCEGLGWQVRAKIPGNDVCVCETIHGQPDAEHIADALNWYARRYSEDP